MWEEWLLTRASNFGLYSGVTVSTYLGISMPAFISRLLSLWVRYIMNQNDICSASNRPEKYFNNMDYFTASVSTKLGRQRSTVSEKTIWYIVLHVHSLQQNHANILQYKYSIQTLMEGNTMNLPFKAYFIIYTQWLINRRNWKQKHIGGLICKFQRFIRYSWV